MVFFNRRQLKLLHESAIVQFFHLAGQTPVLCGHRKVSSFPIYNPMQGLFVPNKMSAISRECLITQTLSILFGINRVIPMSKRTVKLVKLSQINFYVENQTGTKNLKTLIFMYKQECLSALCRATFNIVVYAGNDFNWLLHVYTICNLLWLKNYRMIFCYCFLCWAQIKDLSQEGQCKYIFSLIGEIHLNNSVIL